MAWTKTKKNIATAVVALLLAGAIVATTAIIHAKRRASAPDIQGTWQGLAKIDNDLYLSELGIDGGDPTTSRVVLKLFKTNDIYRATVDWIDLGLKDIPMSKVVYDYPNLEIHVNEREAWKLRVFGETKQMVWDHHYNFLLSAPVLFTPTTKPEAVPERLAESDFTPRPDSVLQGYWVGTIETGPIILSVNFKIAQLPDGTFRAESDDPLKGVQGRPVIVSHHPPSVEFKLANDAGKFQGQMNDSNTIITGFWIKGGRSIPEIVRRVDYRAEHEHDTDKDYSFTSDKDLQGHWTGSWIMPFGSVEVAIHFALDIAKLPDGSYSSTLSSLDQFGAEAPVPTSDFHYQQPNTLHMEWKSMGGAYDGQLVNGIIHGNWLHSGAGFPLDFKRSR